MVAEQGGTQIGRMYVEITGDDKQLSAKLSQVKNNMQDMSRDTKSANADFTRFAKTAGLVAGTLATVGISVGAITALATHSPALAGAMATIAINTFNLGQILGQNVLPIFEAIGQELIPAIGEAIYALNPAISWLVDIVSSGVSDMAKVISGEFDKIEDAGPKSVLVVSMAAAGFALGGFKGMLLGAAMGYAVKDVLRPEMSDEEIEHYKSTGFLSTRLEGNWVQTDRALAGVKEDFIKRYDDWYDVFMPQNNPFIVAGKYTTDVVWNLLWDSINNIMNNWDKNQVEYTAPNGAPRGVGW